MSAPAALAASLGHNAAPLTADSTHARMRIRQTESRRGSGFVSASIGIARDIHDMHSVEILDRSELIERMLELLEIDASDTAILTVDMHRGHLDPEIATMPTTPETARRVIAAAKDLLDFARERRMPVIHAVLSYRKIPGLGSEGMSAPFWAAISEITDEKNRLTLDRASTVNEHNIIGSPGTEIMPELYRKTDFVIDNKKRLDCFLGTDLDLLLRNLQVKTLCLMGINTNTCVLNTAFTAHNLNYRTVVLSDCVASMYGDDLHELGLQNVQRCLGWVVSNETFKQRIGDSYRPAG